MRFLYRGLYTVLFLLIVQSTSAQVPRIFFSVSDTSTHIADSGGWLSVYIDNYQDTVFGFQFVLQSSRPDIVWFDFADGGFDTSGTLVSGFQYMQGLDVNGDQSAFWYRCIADVPWVLGSKNGFGPQQGGVAVRVRYRTASVLPPDTQFVVSQLTIEQPFDFSDPYGVSIGIVVDTSIDTSYWHCAAMLADSCTSWIAVDSTSLLIDSIGVDTTRTPYLDTTQVIAWAGSITVLSQPLCDNDNDGEISIGDLVCLVNYMFIPQVPPLCPDIYCDANHSGEIEIADLTILVAYMFKGGPPP